MQTLVILIFQKCIKENKMKKITKTTFKSFLKKNAGNLFIQSVSDFDGMSDCVEYTPSNKRKFIRLERATIKENDYQYGKEKGKTREEIEASFFSNKNTLGYKGVWLVNDSRDYFSKFDNDEFEGIEVYNCCGGFVIAIPKTA